VGSRLHGVWGDLNVGSVTLASITTRKEADSKRPTKISRKSFCNWKNLFFFDKRVKIKINKYNKDNEKIKIKKKIK